MRILHTSDWHLGRSFHGEDLLAAQAAYVDHLIDTVEAEDVDLVVVSGDIYDRALPPVDAVALADEAFTRLAASRARVVVTSGNHDSARRLGFSSRLVDAAGVHLRTDAGRADEPVLLEDEHGPVAVYGIPYLEPDVLHRAWDLPARSHHAALAEAMRAHPRPTWPPGPRAPGRWSWPTRSSPAVSPVRASATSRSAASRSFRWSCSPASTTPRSATSTAARR